MVPASILLNPLSPSDRFVFSNRVDPDEAAHNDPSHQDLRCLSVCVDF